MSLYGFCCSITSISSPSAPTLRVAWDAYPGAGASYRLNLRAVNSTDTAPVMVDTTATQRLVQGLRPGSYYDVTLKALQYYTERCRVTQRALTVPAASQITTSEALASTSIRFQWSAVTGADRYFLILELYILSQGLVPTRTQVYNGSFTSVTGQVDGLNASTRYNCFVISYNSAGPGAPSRSKIVSTPFQPPTGVTVTPTGRSTATVAWDAVNMVLRYRVTFSDDDDGSVAPVSRDTELTSMDITDLGPCSNYTVGVASVNNFRIAGEAANVSHTTATIKRVSMVQTNYSCANGMATVTWGLVFGANSYRATAFDRNGTGLSCNSSSTTCQISNLRCGTQYEVLVTATSDDCESISNTSSLFETVPCAPVGRKIYRECNSNAIIFSWQPTNNTRYYVATSTDSSNKQVLCRTTETSCFFTNSDCGQRYHFTVYAISTCDSEVSPPEFVDTSPCLPTSVRTTLNCETQLLSATWDSVAGAQDYLVEAMGNNGDQYNCSSSNNSCALASLPCGEHLSVWITASNEECSTNRVLGEAAETVPCSPTNVSAVVGCSPDSARVNWTASGGAVFYIATAKHGDGPQHSCTSYGTNCLIERLTCGQDYNVSLTATNFKCNSSISAEFAITTAPCPPQSVQATINCEANTAVIDWQHSQPTGNFMALLEDQKGQEHRLNCTSNVVNSCQISALPCGRMYNITVTYDDERCPMTSTAVSMASVPCRPEDVRTNVSCSTGELTVSWGDSIPALNYTTTITSVATGQQVHCNSTEMQCTQSGLPCGSAYSVAVSSYRSSCVSFPSANVSVETVLCSPTNVTATQSCGQTSVPVSWLASLGAVNYTAFAVSSTGQRTECSVTGTSCVIQGSLHCGQVYTIAVVAVNDNCTSQESQSISLYTALCSPTNLREEVTSGSHIPMAVQVTWDMSPVYGAIYTLRSEVVGVPGSNSTNSTTHTNFTLAGLQCGQRHSIRVKAEDGNCTSAESPAIEVATASCMPANLTARVDCGTSMGNFSWSETHGVDFYTVEVTGDDGHMDSCTSTHTSCVVRLHCGCSYAASLVVSAGGSNSSKDAAINFDSGPCMPQAVVTNSECNSSIASVSWTASNMNETYIAVATGLDVHTHKCVTNTSSCTWDDLHCGEKYTVHVTARNGNCTSLPSNSSVIHMAPCPPQNISGTLDCVTNSAWISWNSSQGAVSYTVMSLVDGDHRFNCTTSTNSTCEVQDLECGAMYNFSVIASNSFCDSIPSTPIELETAPCSLSAITASVQCHNSSILVVWETMAGGEGNTQYNATAEASDRTYLYCNSTDTHCTLWGARCDLRYTIIVAASSDNCSGLRSPPFRISMEPCPPRELVVNTSCGDSGALVSWRPSPVAEDYLVTARAADGHMPTCNTSFSNCSLSDLHCGQQYMLSVTASRQNCSSRASQNVTFNTVICQPDVLSVSIHCANQSAVLSWTPVGDVVGYSASAENEAGDMLFCNSSSEPTCTMDGLQCGSQYNFSVQASDGTCNRSISEPVLAGGVLCSPTNVTATQSCGQTSVPVSWLASLGAVNYTAFAVSSTGQRTECSVTGTSCVIQGSLHCGQVYTIAVVAVNDNCTSQESQSISLYTALCSPTNLREEVTSGSHIPMAVQVTWDMSPVYGAIYTLRSEVVGVPGSNSTNSTTHTNFTLAGLQCGQRHSIRVKAEDGNCTSAESPAIEVATASCMPANLTARVDCGTSMGNFSWSETHGVDFYTVEVTGDDGHMDSCTSTHTSCVVRLHCGCSYAASLVVSAGGSNSSKDAAINFDSGPCMPQAVVTNSECNSSIASVSWTASNMNETYIAVATGLDGHTHKCVTNTSSCTWDDLHCGEEYTVQVMARNGNCTSLPSNSSVIHMAPCPPQNISGTLDCVTNSAWISWNSSQGAVSYTVMSLVDGDHRFNCTTSTNSTCEVQDLECGAMYNFSVIASNSFCDSIPSTPIELETAPCSLSAITASVQCHNSSILVVWETMAGGEGNTQYNATAEASDRTYLYCNSTDTHCTLWGARCDLRYTIIVAASSDNCSGLRSPPFRISMEPCPPRELVVNTSCGDSGALVSWRPSPVAEDYLVTARAADGHMPTCNTSFSNCSLSDLHCGQQYMLSVTASRQNCSSRASQNVTFNTVICQPDVLSVSIHCANQSAVLSWTPVGDVVGYSASAENEAGDMLFCNSSSEPTCTMDGLQCGSQYNFSVQASDGTCNRSISEPVLAGGVLCSPTNVTATQSCGQTSVPVSWLASLGAVNYTAFAVSSTGQRTECSVTGTSCVIQGSLHCGQVYTIAVVAVNDNCTSQESQSISLYTALCSPTNLREEVTSGSHIPMAVQVTWDMSPVYGAIYTLRSEVVGVPGSNSTNSTTHTNFTLAGLQCGQRHSIRVKAEDGNCTSAESPAIEVATASCMPANLTARVDCGTSMGNFSWSETHGVDFYTVEVTGDDGHMDSCTSTHTSCVVRLHCGCSYAASLVVSAGGSNSSKDAAINFDSGPCMPQAVVTNSECNSSIASVSWTASNMNETYIAVATGLDGHTHKCVTNTSSCTWDDLHCGEEYTVQVMARNGNCTSLPSNSSVIHMAPCPPQNISGTLDCVTNSAWISWNSSQGAVSYTVMSLVDGDHRFNCTTSTNSTCEVQDLECGAMYNFSVIASNSFCDSIPSTPIELETAPCSLSAMHRIRSVPQLFHPCGLGRTMAGGARGNTQYNATAEGKRQNLLVLQLHRHSLHSVGSAL
ncbi:unnamed protein product [Arctogadus glacialis]